MQVSQAFISDLLTQGHRHAGAPKGSLQALAHRSQQEVIAMQGQLKIVTQQLAQVADTHSSEVHLTCSVGLCVN